MLEEELELLDEGLELLDEELELLDEEYQVELEDSLLDSDDDSLLLLDPHGQDESLLGSVDDSWLDMEEGSSEEVVSEDSDWLDSLDMRKRVRVERKRGVRDADGPHTGGSSDDSEEDEEGESLELSELDSLDGGSTKLELERLGTELLLSSLEED